MARALFSVGGCGLAPPHANIFVFERNTDSAARAPFTLCEPSFAPLPPRANTPSRSRRSAHTVMRSHFYASFSRYPNPLPVGTSPADTPGAAHEHGPSKVGKKHVGNGSTKVVGCLNAVAVGGLAVDAAGVVRVEEVILVVILVRLPLGEGKADREDDAAEHEAKGVVVDAQGLRR